MGSHSLLFALRYLLIAGFIYCLAPLALVGQAAVVKTVHDDKGWKLTVDGRDFAIKGVVWSYTPPGENYTYDLWAHSDDEIYRVIDTDMALMRTMGVTAIRVFSTVPARWIEYIYDRFGIYTMVNDLFGRYGLFVDGAWQFPTDYSNPSTRRTLLEQAQKTFETYKDTRGVLLYMLGNESNYGLEWTSSAIENLPGGERDALKAKALYSIFEEALKLGKTIDTNHPMGLINGDLGYLQVMKDLVPDLDILGVNTYRGAQSFNAFYSSIAKDLGKPFVYTELGADAYNVATEQEDQDNQAKLLQAQWQEIYQQAYGKGKSANALGAFVFEWMDEWWKNSLETNLLVHDTKATWNNGAYTFDSVAGKNNMNEEWFGILGMSQKTLEGVNRRLPRTAYYLLQDLWRLDMYTSTKDDVAKKLSSLNFEAASRQGNLAQVRDATTDPKPLWETHGSVMARTDLKGDSTTWAASGTSGLTPLSQVESRFGVTVRPSEGLTASFQYRVLPSQLINDPSVDLNDPWESATKLSGTSPVVGFELYQATVDYQSNVLRATVHYHDGHTDWVQQGDLFGLLPESFDLVNPDRDNSKRPFGVELSLPGLVPGLTIYAGPELYWSAKPRVMVLYNLPLPAGLSLTVLHDEELAVASDAATNSAKTADRSTSIDFGWQVPRLFSLEAGALLGRYDRVTNAAHTYSTLVNDAVVAGNQFTWMDALAGKIRLTSDALPYLRFAFQFLYAGALADTQAATAREGSQLGDVGTGNRQELSATVTAQVGDFSLRTTGLFRNPLITPIDKSLYGSTRDPLNSEFTVWNNRKAIQAESILTWDRTGATYFHDWNNPDREESPLSASVGGLYNLYLGPTDASSYYSTTGVLTAFTSGLPAVSGTYSVVARAAGRPLPEVRVDFTAQTGQLQSTGISTRLTPFSKASAKVATGRLYLEGSYAIDAGASFDWYRQFNTSYPIQAMAGIAWGLTPLSFLTDTNRVGVRVNYREYGPYSGATEVSSGLKFRFTAELYAGYTF